jgi:hypothetical protein
MCELPNDDFLRELARDNYALEDYMHQVYDFQDPQREKLLKLAGHVADTIACTYGMSVCEIERIMKPLTDAF